MVIVIPMIMILLKQRPKLKKRCKCRQIFRGKNQVTYRGITLTPEEEEAIKSLLDEKSNIIEGISKMMNQTKYIHCKKARKYPCPLINCFQAMMSGANL